MSSIKRIIAEDGDTPATRSGKRQTARPQPVELVPDPEDGDDDTAEVLELTDTVVPETGDDAAAPMVAEAAEEDLPVLPPVSKAPPIDADDLISSVTANASRQSLTALSRLIVKPEDAAADNTLEGLVRELLRPMLKTWLDAHLPDMVEAMVAKEISRISGQAL